MQRPDISEKTFRKHLSALQEVFDFIHSFFLKNKIDDEFRFSVDLVIEEMFTNMIKYNRESDRDITLGLELVGKRLIMKLVDSDVEPFDITKAGNVDISARLAERKPGGLGIHLVRNLVDDMKYEYSDRQSKITLTKYLESTNV